MNKILVLLTSLFFIGVSYANNNVAQSTIPDLMPAYITLTLVNDGQSNLAYDEVFYSDVTNEGVMGAIGVIPAVFSKESAENIKNIKPNTAISGEFVMVRPAPYGEHCPDGTICLNLHYKVSNSGQEGLLCTLRLEYGPKQFYEPVLTGPKQCGVVSQVSSATETNKANVIWDVGRTN